MNFLVPFEKATDAQLCNLENRFSIELPKDYKEFLLKIGGGVVQKSENNRINVPGLSTSIVVDVLYGIDDNNKNSSIQYWMSEYGDELLPNTVIIGDDIQQGFIVLICSGKNKGVYYWDDAYNFECSNEESNMYKIANTFRAFWELLSS